MINLSSLKKFLVSHKELLMVTMILLLATFFRFYKLQSFQYWSTDDEIFSAVVTRMIFENKVTLVSPNATLGVSLGSFFHILSIIPYKIARLDASLILAFGSLLGVVTTFLIYQTGKLLGGKLVGIFTSFLYGVSFLISFTDRRWWPLTPDAFLATLGIFSIIKLFKGELRYALTLAVSASFAWHSDPTLLVVSVAALLSFVLFRLPILKRAYILAAIYLVISLLPFVFFEIRHPGSVSHPIVHFVTGSHKLAQSDRLASVVKNDFVGNFSRALFLSPTSDLENYLLYCVTCKDPPYGQLIRVVTIMLIVLPIFLLKKNPSLKPVYVYLASFVLGSTIFSTVFGTAIYLHFYVVVWPAFLLLAGVSLAFLWQKGFRLAVTALLTAVFLSNFNVILESQMRYPLKDKLAAANFGVQQVKNSPFSLVVDVDQRRLDGMGGLFYLKNVYPGNASYYEGWNWIYMAYSLYGRPIEPIDPTKTIVISPSSDTTERGAVKVKNFGNIKVSVIE